MKDGTSGVKKRRLVVLLAVVAATGLGVLAAGAVAQVDTTPSGNGVTATAEVTTSQQATITGEVATTQEVVPAGGTAAGAGGTAQDGRSLLPILLGVAGLGMLLVAAGFARRRRFD